MKKILTAICSLAIAATSGLSLNSFAELDDVVTGTTTITIDAVDLTGSATFAVGFTVDPNAATLAGIWTGDTVTVTNFSGAPIFYVYTDATSTGAALNTAIPAAAYDDALAADATALAWTALATNDYSARADEQWTNMGITATNTDWWLGDITGGTKTLITGIFTGEGTGVVTDNILASKWAAGDPAVPDTATDALAIRTGTSFASALTVGVSVVLTFELTAGTVTL